MRDVTERDFRMPEFINADPKDYEFRTDGKIVRRDRWETGIHRIKDALGNKQREFEIDDIVNAVKSLIAFMPDQPCECGNPVIFDLGECKDCWDYKELLDQQETREIEQHAIDNHYSD